MEAVSKNKEWLNDEALLENGIKSLSIGTENIYDKLLIYIDLFGLRFMRRNPPQK